MTLDEAIAEFEDMADRRQRSADCCNSKFPEDKVYFQKAADKNKQIAEWLKELKELRVS